ncbi:MAG: hypothetical protein J6S14_15065 [Clostridia bacterium]|nr:hypothetical protein [Clostridia bacterium]
MITYIEYLGLPGTVAVCLVAAFFFMQIIGLILDIKGKAVPMVMNIWGYFRKRRQEKEESKLMLAEVRQLLADVNAHYSADNIEKRNSWMKWVNDRADVYDGSISEINGKLDMVTQALQDNTKVTEEMFVQTSRDRIIDFATKVGRDDVIVSREEFKRIFKIYERYESFLEDRGMTNGEIDINYHIIEEAYERHVKNHTFAEDVRGYE